MESGAIVSQICLTACPWCCWKISDPALSPLSHLLSLHKSLCKNGEDHLGQRSSRRQGNAAGFLTDQSPQPIHLTTAQTLVLQQGRGQDEQLGTQRGQDSFIGATACLNIKIWGVRASGFHPEPAVSLLGSCSRRTFPVCLHTASRALSTTNVSLWHRRKTKEEVWVGDWNLKHLLSDSLYSQRQIRHVTPAFQCPRTEITVYLIY